METKFVVSTDSPSLSLFVFPGMVSFTPNYILCIQQYLLKYMKIHRILPDSVQCSIIGNIALIGLLEVHHIHIG